MSFICKRYGRWGTNTKTSNIVTMGVKGTLPAKAKVMLCPDDPLCETVMEWDKKDECEIFGESQCLFETPEGKCIAVRVLDQVGGLMSGGKGSNLDTEQDCYCDENGVEYTKVTTWDNSEEPPVVAFEQNFDADGNLYTPVGKSTKGPIPKKVGFELCPPNQTIDLEPGTVYDITSLIPANAVGAIVTFIKTEPCCTFKVALDGEDPNTNGELVGAEDQICLGCTQISNGSPNDLKLFKVTAVDDCKARALIKFYKTKILK